MQVQNRATCTFAKLRSADKWLITVITINTSKNSKCCKYVLLILSSFFSVYLAEGFLHIQNLIGQAIVDWKLQQKVEIDISVRVSMELVS